VEIGLRCGPTFYHTCSRRFSTVDSTVDTSLPLIHHSTIITLVTVRHTQIMLCSQSIYIKLNFSKFHHSYNNITLLFLHRSLPLTGISNLPSPFIPLSFSECHAPTVVTSKIVERKTKKDHPTCRHRLIKHRYVEWQNGGGIALLESRLRLRRNSSV